MDIHHVYTLFWKLSSLRIVLRVRLALLSLLGRRFSGFSGWGQACFVVVVGFWVLGSFIPATNPKQEQLLSIRVHQNSAVCFPPAAWPGLITEGSYRSILASMYMSNTSSIIRYRESFPTENPLDLRSLYSLLTENYLVNELITLLRTYLNRAGSALLIIVAGGG